MQTKVDLLNETYPDIHFTVEAAGKDTAILGRCTESLDTVVYAYYAEGSAPSIAVAEKCGSKSFRASLISDLKN